MFPGTQPMIAQVPLHLLSDFPITTAMTLYVPPARIRMPDPEMLGLFSLSTPYGAIPTTPQPNATEQGSGKEPWHRS